MAGLHPWEPEELNLDVPPGPIGEHLVMHLATMSKDVTINHEKFLEGRSYSVTRSTLEHLRSLGAVS